MILQLTDNISDAQLLLVEENILSLDFKITPVTTQSKKYLVCIGTKDFDIRTIGNLEGVADIHRVSDNYKLVSKKWKVHYSSIDLGNGVIIGGNKPTIIADPCSIESKEQVETIIQHLITNKIKIMRGGVFKPRSFPYSFKGLGLEGMKMFYKACKAHHIKIITEVMHNSQIEILYPYVDIFQVGTRNYQNFNLLDALGEIDKPVMIKRGMSGTIDELLQSVEYVFSGGNEKLILCERGIRTFESSYRNTFDINAIQVLKDKTHLPVLADPSHGVGIRHHVPKLALASLVAGADGIIYEVHPNPEKAISDGQQSLNFDESTSLIKNIQILSEMSNNF